MFPLIKKTLNTIYYVKIFIKFDVSIIFNYIRIKLGYE